MQYMIVMYCFSFQLNDNVASKVSNVMEYYAEYFDVSLYERKAITDFEDVLPKFLNKSRNTMKQGLKHGLSKYCILTLPKSAQHIIN